MLKLRDASAQDARLIIAYVRELAAFEKLESEFRADENLLRRFLFGETPRGFAVMAEWADAPAGFALYFYNFSTFLGRPGLFVEDVFVRPAFRGKGIGRALFQHMAAKAVAEGCGRMEWSVLDWNADAIRFYRGLGAEALDEWTGQRLTGQALEKLASG